MDHKTLPSSAKLIIHEEIASTSSQIKPYAQTLSPDQKIWLLAKRQTDGYGRHGNQWHQQEGDFAGSFLFNPNTTPELIAQLSFLVGLTVKHTLDGFLKQAGRNGDALTLKWPNDILLNGEKISGILLELLPQKEEYFLSIGIGINIVSAPDHLPYRATHLSRFGITPSIGAMVEALDKNLHGWLEIWSKYGFAPIREEWCKNAEKIGRQIGVRMGDKTLIGCFETINEQGCLVLKNDGQDRAISAGEIFFPDDP